MEKIPRPGEFYRHFKGRLYQIITVAGHSETGEEMVVYQALYGDFKTYVRPLSMFTGPVDHAKYPEAVQTFRFEQCEPGNGGRGGTCGFVIKEQDQDNQKLEYQLDPLVLSFLEGESYEEKINVLYQAKGRIAQREIETIYISLDLQPFLGTPDEQIDSLIQYLKTQQRYDGTRLR